jgi:glutaryl-CoA dehydrogenase
MKLNGLDYLNISPLLSDEELMVQHTTREFVESDVLPIIEKYFQDGVFPMHLVTQMGELGFLGAHYPKEYGCAELSNISYGLLCQELERGDSGIRSFVSVQGSLVMYPIFVFGSESQKKKWLPKLASGETIGCFGLTESEHGSDPGSMVTTAEKVQNGYILNGAKMWITNGTIADIAIVWAKLDGEIQGFIVEKEFVGFSAPEMKNKWSLRASVTSELVLNNVFVPRENVLLNARGLKAPLQCLTQARYGITWGSIGSAMAVYEVALQYAKNRKQFGKSIASKQLIQEKLVWMLSEITKGQLLAYHVGRNNDNKTMKHQQVSLAKRNNVWVARECARLAREILGANGISSDYPVMRHLMNIESVYTYEGTHDIHTLILGEDITGETAI